MGNKTGNVTSADFNAREWQITDKQTSQSENKGNFKVLQNMKTGELVDEYQLYWPSEEDFKFYLDSYYWRRQEYNIVPSRYIVEQHSDQFCSRSYGAKVYIEHIQTRLSDVTDIPFPDNLYVVLGVLEGYQKLYENVHHYFPISEDQICVDRQGVVKVWVNSDLSKNYPEPQQATTENKDEAHMVEELLNIVWENTDEESEPQSFRQFFAKKKGKKRIGFDQAKVIVNEYAKIVSCQIPQKFNSILQMIEQSDFQDHQNQQQEMDNDRELHNMEHGYEERYGYGQGEGYEQGYEEGQQHQSEYFGGNNQGRQVYHHQQYAQSHPQSQQFIHDQQQVYYNQVPISAPIYQNHIPIPHAINPITPIQYKPLTGPLISIPPMRRNVTTIINPIPAQFQTFNPVAHYQQVNQVPYHLSQQQQYVLPHQRQVVMNQQHYFGEQQHQMNHNNQLQQQGLNTEVFGNVQGNFQQHISTLNPQSGSSSHNAYQATNDYHQTQYPSRQELNSSVGRSLQLINQSSKKAQQLQKLRVNKSHINQLGQVVQVNYPRQQQQQAFNSRISGSNRMGESQERNSRNVEELQYIRQELLDTKYYTIDTEVELDEEIAADLKKMILAL